MSERHRILADAEGRAIGGCTIEVGMVSRLHGRSTNVANRGRGSSPTASRSPGRSRTGRVTSTKPSCPRTRDAVLSEPAIPAESRRLQQGRRAAATSETGARAHSTRPQRRPDLPDMPDLSGPLIDRRSAGSRQTA